MIRILGAGLSGLSAAINLAKAGKEVSVFEIKKDVGMHMHPNFQGLLRTEGKPIEYLKSLNLSPKFEYKNFSKMLLCTRKRELNVNLKEPIPFVLRGGKDSLEYGLFKEAQKSGVAFEFSTMKKEKDVNIVATGHKRCDMAAFGVIYENTTFARDSFLYMHDDRFSPTGWYFYIIPVDKKRIEVVNCCSQPHVPKVKELFYRAIRERKIVSDIIKDSTELSTFGGFGGADVPKTAIIDGRLYVGEAAGFQDPFRGFGMNYALESGKLAADSIIQGKNYDALWKKQFTEQMKTDFARRYVMAQFGDKMVERYFRKVKEGDTLDFDTMRPKGLAYNLAESLAYRLGFLRRKIRGYW